MEKRNAWATNTELRKNTAPGIDAFDDVYQ